MHRRRYRRAQRSMPEIAMLKETMKQVEQVDKHRKRTGRRDLDA